MYTLCIEDSVTEDDDDEEQQNNLRRQRFQEEVKFTEYKKETHTLIR
jgi:hypothetical protein